jgi:hypothetical protein
MALNGLLHLYNTLNMFRALLCPSSRARDYVCVIAAYGVQCSVAGVRCRAAGYASRNRDVARLSRATSLFLDTQPAALHLTPTTSNQELHTIGGNNTHIVLSSWWWAQKCPKHVEHIISAINHSVASSWFFVSTHMQRCTDKHTSSSEVIRFKMIGH